MLHSAGENVLTVPLCGIWFMNYAIYFLVDTAPAVKDRRRNNEVVLFLYKRKHIIYYTSYEFLAVIETSNIDFNEYVFVFYDSEYVFT